MYAERVYLFVSLVLILLGLIISLPFLKREKSFRLYRFEGRCPGYENASMAFTENHIIQIKRMWYFSTKVVVLRDIGAKQFGQIQLDRCKSKEALDTCQSYQDLNVPNICDTFNSNLPQTWAFFISHLQPQLPCPAKKGTYVCTNCTFDDYALAILPLEGWYWKARASVYEVEDYSKKSRAKGTLVMCTQIEGQVVTS